MIDFRTPATTHPLAHSRLGHPSAGDVKHSLPLLPPPPSPPQLPHHITILILAVVTGRPTDELTNQPANQPTDQRQSTCTHTT